MTYSILKDIKQDIIPEIKNLVHVNNYLELSSVTFFDGVFHIKNNDTYNINLDNNDIIVFKDTTTTFDNLSLISTDILRDGSSILFFPFDDSINEINGKYTPISMGHTIVNNGIRGLLSLNGVSDYLKLMTTSIELTNFSINVWFKDNGSNDYAHILVAEDQNLFYFKYWQSHNTFYVGSSSVGSNCAPDNILMNDEIAMLTVTHNDGLIKLYKNSILVAEFNISMTLPATSYRIGNYNNEYGKQEEANLRIFNKGLNSLEIETIFNIEREQFGF